MTKHSIEEIDKMRNYVITNLVADYHYDETEARLIVLDSIFNELLKEETEYVFHYSVGYWAKEVQTEYLS